MLRVRWAILVVVLAIIGSICGYRFSYYREARKVRDLAGRLDDVVVHEVDGNHDLTLEGIWLYLSYRGESIDFEVVTEESFTGTDHLRVSRVGAAAFQVCGYDVGVASPEFGCVTCSSCLDFGPSGDVGRRLDPPIRSIPEFLRRLPEVREVIRGLPDRAPGVIVGEESIGSIDSATGKRTRRELRLRAHRVPPRR